MGRFRYLFYIAAAVGLYALWTLAVFPMAADHTPACGLCHAPRQAYSTAYGSAHEDVGCLACHRSPGLTGAVASDFRGWRNLASWAFRRPPRDYRVDNDSCLSCHDEVLNGITRSKELKMSHREVVDAGWRCAECHGETGHKLHPGKSTLQLASMDKCFGCHTAKKSLGRCRLCHYREIEDEKPDDPKTLGSVAHTTGWKSKRHGAADNSQCPVCHQGSFCRDCHGIDLPHPDDSWPLDHADVASTDGDACRRCHSRDFCSDCHGVPMPHTTDYLTEHMADVKKPSVCENCHLRDECLACHDTHRLHEVRRRAKNRVDEPPAEAAKTKSDAGTRRN